MPRKRHRLSPGPSGKPSSAPSSPFSSPSATEGRKLTCTLFPAQALPARPPPAAPGSRKLPKLFLMSWHSAWLSWRKAALACGARMLVKEPSPYTGSREGQPPQRGLGLRSPMGSAPAALGVSTTLQGPLAPLPPCLLPRKPLRAGKTKTFLGSSCINVSRDGKTETG